MVISIWKVVLLLLIVPFIFHRPALQKRIVLQGRERPPMRIGLKLFQIFRKMFTHSCRKVRSSDPIPDLKIVVENMLVDKEHVKEYIDVIKRCHYREKDYTVDVNELTNVPLLYFEGTSTQLMISMLAHPAFPFKPVGGVHIRSKVQ